MSSSSPSSTATVPGATTPEPVPGGSYREAAAPALWLVRHGESTWNLAGLAQGHNDEAELTERGLRQAAEAAAQFGYRPARAIYASDLRRARQTAAAFAEVLGLPVHYDRRLRERSLGVLEGVEHRSIGPSVTGFADGLVVDPDTRPLHGESLRDLYRRAAEFCDELAAAVTGTAVTGTAVTGTAVTGTAVTGSAVTGSAVPGTGGAFPSLAAATGDVLVIAHGGTVRVLDAYLHGVPVDQMTWRPVDNATIVRIPAFGTSLPGGN
jgi:2,3-bisphosphoglycerate-dependent phosphoglycerate mutase